MSVSFLPCEMRSTARAQRDESGSSVVAVATGIAELLRSAGMANDMQLCVEAFRMATESLREEPVHTSPVVSADPAPRGERVPREGHEVLRQDDARPETVASSRALWPYEDLELEPIDWGE